MLRYQQRAVPHRAFDDDRIGDSGSRGMAPLLPAFVALAGYGPATPLVGG